MEKVLEIFKELSAIPRGSGNVRAASDWCAAYARARGLEAEQDAYHNCLIRIPATPDKKDRPILILQGHLDMVCAKEPDCDHDFEKDGIELLYDGDWLTAQGTTLGGDNGIAIAIALSLIDRKELSHPALELFFTADEETGMDGAFGFDPAILKGRMLLNIDSEDEGVIFAACAGGRNVLGRLAAEYEPCALPAYEISVSGLQGGHSGAEIHRGRANANILLGKILSGLGCRLISMEGGEKPNVIAPRAAAKVAMEQPIDSEALTALFRREYGDRDPELTISVCTTTADRMLTKECSDRAIRLLSSLPDGVQKWSEAMEGIVETSLYCGIITTEENSISILTSLRSMKNADRDALADRVVALFEGCGFEAKTDGVYPAWEYRAESPLRDTAAACWKKISGKPAKTTAIHAGLECGLFDEKLPGLDAISIGPNMQDIHTPRERLSLSSSERVLRWVEEIIKTI